MVAEMEAERDRSSAEVARLEQQKARLLGELRRLHEALGSVANLSVDSTAEAVEAGDQTTRELPPPQQVADRNKPAA
jgi:hypothetical protein